MAIPVVYNLRSVRARWLSAVVAVFGIAGTVGVFVAMMSLARGFQATLISSGSPSNAIVLRAGSGSEMSGSVTLDQVRIIEDAPGVARSSDGPLVTPEVVVVAAFPLRSTGTDANVQVRGVSPKALQVRSNIKIVEGRFFQPGLAELVVGRNVSGAYRGLNLGDSVNFGGGTWRVVGVFDAGGSAFDSEVWCDAHVLNQIYHRPDNIFQSVTARLTSPEALHQLKDALSADPRMNVDVTSELDYYANQSTVLTQVIQVLGGFIAIIMGIGAVFGALNTMYSAVAERGREIATMRALGFAAGSIIFSFMIEALLIAAAGGALGCLAVLPVNGFTTGTLNFQTFSHLAFAFKITPLLLASGIGFALIMGLVGGLPPAIRAAR
ncbi:MAG TPA: ABC transporter permease, partial [Terriglobales bacterium]